MLAASAMGPANERTAYASTCQHVTQHYGSHDGSQRMGPLCVLQVPCKHFARSISSTQSMSYLACLHTVRWDMVGYVARFVTCMRAYVDMGHVEMRHATHHRVGAASVQDGRHD